MLPARKEPVSREERYHQLEREIQFLGLEMGLYGLLLLALVYSIYESFLKLCLG